MASYSPFYSVNSDLGNLGNFGSLVRFIDDWDKHVNTSKAQQAQTRPGSQRHPSRRNALPTFTPRFDVQETEQNFELHGELPGVDKKDVHIEFTEPQTIVIKGSVDRTYSSGTPPAGLLENTQMSGAITHEVADEEAHEHASSSFQPTVEDEKEGEEGASVSTVAKSQSKQHGNQSPQEPKARYWVYERNVGSFQRTFTFSSRVDQENVHASLENGILHIVVPKAKKPESRRIAIH
ncbi:30 kDa heat shock protein [Xylariaceae sp. FL0594]|nr:30 kDa heat shock protein [Xylariaceae sp. FL0594]